MFECYAYLTACLREPTSIKFQANPSGVQENSPHIKDYFCCGFYRWVNVEYLMLRILPGGKCRVPNAEDFTGG